MVKLKIVLHLSMGSLLNPSVEFPPNRPMHDCARLCGITPGRRRRDRLRLRDRSQQGQLTFTEDNGILKPGNHSLASALLVNIGRMGRISNEKLEEGEIREHGRLGTSQTADRSGSRLHSFAIGPYKNGISGNLPCEYPRVRGIYR
jgi:hypothetical protein